MTDTSVDDNKTPEDLEAEIAATARALGGKSPKEKKVANTAETNEEADTTADEASGAEKSEETTPEVEDNTPAPETDSTPTTDDKPAEDEGEKLTVTIKTKQAATPPPDEPEEDKTAEKPTVIKHSGKKLAPISQPQTEDDTTEEVSEEPASEENDEETAQESTATETVSTDDVEKPAEDAPQDEASRKLAAMSGELRAREAQKANTAQTEEQQTAKVYDTKKYHLPIKAGRHHRRSGFPKWLQLAIVLFVIFGSAYYVWANDLLSFNRPSETATTQSTESTAEQGAVGLQNQTGVSVMHLLPGIENYGSGIAEITYSPSPILNSEYVSIVMPFVQNKAGAVWFQLPTLAVQVVNEYLVDNAVSENELVESKIAADFIDIYGYAPLLADNGSQSLSSTLAGLEGEQAVQCQSAIDSANVALIGDLRLQDTLTKTNKTDSSVTYRGEKINVESFYLEGEALSIAKQQAEAAIESCLVEGERAAAQAYLLNGDQVRYRVSKDTDTLYVDVYNTESNRLLFRAYVNDPTGTKSSLVPQIVNTIFHPLTRLTSITAACGELPQQVDIAASPLKLIQDGAADYQIIPEFDVPLVCKVDNESLEDLPKAEAINLTYDASTYVSLIEMLRDDSFPSQQELTTALSEIDSSIPVPDGSEIFYSPLPEGCASNNQESCILYVLDIAP